MTLGKKEKLQNYFVLFKAQASRAKVRRQDTFQAKAPQNMPTLSLYYIDDVEFKNYFLKKTAMGSV